MSKKDHTMLSKKINGTLHVNLICIPEEVKTISIAPAINAVELIFTRENGSSLIVRSWEFITKKEAKAHFKWVNATFIR